MIHEIECLTQNFEDIVSGVKTFEILENDRNYRVGDYLAINELANNGIDTGKSTLLRIDYMIDDPEYCKETMVVLGIQPCDVAPYGAGKGAVVLKRSQIFCRS